jgi:hypothetical protein
MLLKRFLKCVVIKNKAMSDDYVTEFYRKILEYCIDADEVFSMELLSLGNYSLLELV